MTHVRFAQMGWLGIFLGLCVACNGKVRNLGDEGVEGTKSQGGTTMWLTNRAITSMYHDGTALYYATARSTDVLGNLGPLDGSLYRVAAPNDTPTLVATGFENLQEITGRYSGTTYLATDWRQSDLGLFAVTDGGVVTELTGSCSLPRLQGKWLVYSICGTPQRLVAYNLDSGTTPIELATWGGFGDIAIVGDTVFYRGLGTLDFEGCTVSLTNSSAGPTCDIDASNMFTSIGWVVAADTTRLFVYSVNGVQAYDNNLNLLRTILARDGNVYMGKNVLANDWLYSELAQSNSGSSRLVRYPTTVGRLPQEILPTELGRILFAVDKNDLYWAHPSEDPNAQQYIFHQTLPAQPCDAELPCADTTQTCSGGYCVTP